MSGHCLRPPTAPSIESRFPHSLSRPSGGISRPSPLVPRSSLISIGHLQQVDHPRREPDQRADDQQPRLGAELPVQPISQPGRQHHLQRDGRNLGDPLDGDHQGRALVVRGSRHRATRCDGHLQFVRRKHPNRVFPETSALSGGGKLWAVYSLPAGLSKQPCPGSTVFSTLEKNFSQMGTRPPRPGEQRVRGAPLPTVDRQGRRAGPALEVGIPPCPNVLNKTRFGLDCAAHRARSDRSSP